jgi:hypothetical protein
MTKYVLNSGGLKNNVEGAKLFFAEVLKGLGDNPKLLFCFFAEKRENWEQKFPTYVEGFKAWMPEGINPQFELAFPETFADQIANNDVLYMHGGDDHLIRYWLEQFNLPEIWKNKVVATNSASSDILSKSFWTCDWRQCKDGLGILPIKFIPHYDSDYGKDDPRGPIDWQKAYNELQEYGDKDLPIYALKEGEYKVFEVDD